MVEDGSPSTIVVLTAVSIVSDLEHGHATVDNLTLKKLIK
jgi:hypothetical protein